jgi:hypothetical protein
LGAASGDVQRRTPSSTKSYHQSNGIASKSKDLLEHFVNMNKGTHLHFDMIAGGGSLYLQVDGKDRSWAD